jgi:hypothetical protein
MKLKWVIAELTHTKYGKVYRVDGICYEIEEGVKSPPASFFVIKVYSAFNLKVEITLRPS